MSDLELMDHVGFIVGNGDQPRPRVVENGDPNWVDAQRQGNEQRQGYEQRQGNDQRPRYEAPVVSFHCDGVCFSS